MEEHNDRLSELRRKRELAIQKATHLNLRARYGPRLAAIVSEAAGKPLSLESFGKPPTSPKIEWPNEIASAPGLVFPYVTQQVVQDFLCCLDATLGFLSGQVGFHDKDYFGFADIDEVKASSLLTMAEASNDSVILYVRHPIGAILVDYYRSPPSEPYSVVVQGSDLVAAAKRCFDHCRSAVSGPGGR